MIMKTLLIIILLLHTRFSIPHIKQHHEQHRTLSDKGHHHERA